VRCGSCNLVPPLLTVPASVSLGRASIPVPVPCDPLLLGAVLRVQWWTVGARYTACSLAPNVGFSDVLDATIGM
jgi:hypothetical protein